MQRPRTSRLILAPLAAAIVAFGMWVALAADTTTGTAVGAGAVAPAAPLDTVVTATTVAPTTTPAPPPPSVTLPTAPHETLVATIDPAVTVLDVFEAPDGDPAVLEFALTNPTFFGNELVLMVTDVADDGDWLKVQVPVRPNGSEVWIRTADASLSSHRYRAEVSLGTRSVRVWNDDELIVETGAVIGADRSPTPLGRFFVNDLVEKWEGSAYGPWVLSLSAFSEVLDEFAGGEPVIAIHGTNQPELIGGAHSNGCIRVPNEVVRLLATTVPMGTPVDITT